MLNSEIASNLLDAILCPGINPEVCRLVNKLYGLMNEQGLRIKIVSGYRSYAEQDKLYAKGRTRPGRKVTNAKGGYSWHNFGLAVDFTFADPKNATDLNWNKLGKAGTSLGLEWGGTFRTIIDKPHFQLTRGLKLIDARRLARDGLKAVWAEVEKRGKK